MQNQKPAGETKPWRTKIYEPIFEADTPSGKLFDVLLIFAILLSVTVVFLESIEKLKKDYGQIFFALEWVNPPHSDIF